MRPLSFAAIALAAAGVLACSKGGEQPAQPPKRGPVPVVVVKAVQADVPIELRATGTVEPVQSTPVRAQIGGTIVDVKVREGGLVGQGQVLFQIDSRPYEAALRQLTANLARDEAQVKNTEAQVKNAEAQVKNAEAQAANADSQVRRYEELIQKDFVTREQYDQRRTNADTARAGVAAAKAAVDAAKAQVEAAKAAAEATRAAIENAKLQIGYLVIRSPVAGQIGSLLANQGDLIKASDTQLVVVNQLQPILVRFTVPEPSLPDVRKYWKAGTTQVRVLLPSEGKPRQGSLVFVDNAVDPASGTIALKAQFENGDTALWPGQFVGVALVLYTRTKAVVVPSEALQKGQQGSYVFVVGPDGTAAVRPVEPGPSLDGRTVVEAGLQAGETVVTDGQLRLTPGAKVVPKGPEGPPGAAPAGKAAEPKKTKGQGA